MIETKSWLSRAKRLDEEIDKLISIKAETFARVTSVTQSFSRDTVQSTKDPHKLDRLAELEDDIDMKVSELVRVKDEILNAIFRVSDRRYRLILYQRYIDYMTFEQIAVNLHYSYKQVCRLHGRALIEMGGIINGK